MQKHRWQHDHHRPCRIPETDLPGASALLISSVRRFRDAFLRLLGKKRVSRSRPERRPPDAVQRDIAAVTRLIEENPGQALALSQDPWDEDFALIGKLIQTYCFADVNARRIIDSLRHASIGPEARNASRLPDGQVFPYLGKAVDETLPEGSLRDGLLRAAGTVDMHRIHRHNFAHWAVRRIAKYDMFIMFSKNAREAERRDGEPPEGNELKYGLVPLPELRAELSKLVGHSEYLARQAARMENEFDQLREGLDRHGK